MNTNHHRRNFLKRSGLVLLGIIVSPVSSINANDPRQRIEVTQFHMNMLVRLTAFVDDKEWGLQKLRNAFNQILLYERIFSAFDRSSELGQMCRNAIHSPMAVSPDLFEVLNSAHSLAHRSNGAFDPTVGQVLKLWRQSHRTGIPPMPSDIKTRLDCCGYKNMILNPEGKTVRLLKENMLIDLGAIAKGYIGDQIIRYLKEQGIASAAYHAGGDIVTGSAPPGAEGWIIDLPGQSRPWVISEEALSISGDIYQHLDFAGTRYSHVIDPASGQALKGSKPCICKAPSGILADGKATRQSIHMAHEKKALNH